MYTNSFVIRHWSSEYEHMLLPFTFHVYLICSAVALS